MSIRKFTVRAVLNTFLIILSAYSLIWTLMFWFVYFAEFYPGSEWISPLTHNPIFLALLSSPYLDFFPPLINITVSLANVICAINGLLSKSKSEISTVKRGYKVYTVISLIALVIHCISYYGLCLIISSR